MQNVGRNGGDVRDNVTVDASPSTRGHISRRKIVSLCATLAPSIAIRSGRPHVTHPRSVYGGECDLPGTKVDFQPLFHRSSPLARESRTRTHGTNCHINFVLRDESDEIDESHSR